MRIVERLAQRMYEASDPDSLPWSRRGWVVREPWLIQAAERHESTGSLIDRLYVWGKTRLMGLRAPL